MKIYIRLAGGIGNQLFQLAAGLQYANNDVNSIILFDKHLKHYKTKRFCHLDNLFPNKFRFGNPPLVFQLLLRFRVNKFFNFSNIIDERNILLNKKKSKVCIVDGYFQEFKFIEKSVSYLRILFQQVQHTRVTQIFKNQFEDKLMNSAVVHIRRGDYMSKEYSKIYYLLEDKYYNESINCLEFQHIILFSDSEIPKSLSFESKNLIYVSSLGLDDWEEFILMTKFNKYIIANSTFSFWASILSINENNILIGPKFWSKKNIDNLNWNEMLRMFNYKLK